MTTNKKNIWQFPWRYRESIAIVIGVAIVGFILQWIIGPFDFYLLQSPVNLIISGVLVFLLMLFSIARDTPFYRWFSGVPMAVTLIGGLLLLGIIMGLTPQLVRLHPHDTDIFSQLGFRQMTSSWPFVLLYFLLLLSLGSLIMRRIISFRKQDYAFYLNHIGLWLLLFTSGLGAADMKRYVMHVREGEVEWRVYNERGDVLDLPIAIKLNDFHMEEYPPQLAVIHCETGEGQPAANPEYYQIDEKRPKGKIGHWDIHIKKYIHEAVRNSDSTYQEAHMPGASPAVLVEVHDRSTGKLSEGWVCAGNIAQLYMVLNLDDDYCMVMTQPEPKRFVSDIEIFTEENKQGQTLLEVNKPYKLGHWMIYQYSYDSDAGKMSTYSSFELVYDPWIMPAYIGIFLLAVGSICMLWIGNRRKEIVNDVE